MPPPASAPPPRSLYPGAACSPGRCRTIRAPARTERPTPTACPGSIAPTSSPHLLSRLAARLKTNPGARTWTQSNAGSVQSWCLRPLQIPVSSRGGAEYEWSTQGNVSPLPGGSARASVWKSSFRALIEGGRSPCSGSRSVAGSWCSVSGSAGICALGASPPSSQPADSEEESCGAPSPPGVPLYPSLKGVSPCVSPPSPPVRSTSSLCPPPLLGASSVRVLLQGLRCKCETGPVQLRDSLHLPPSLPWLRQSAACAVRGATRWRQAAGAGAEVALQNKSTKREHSSRPLVWQIKSINVFIIIYALMCILLFFIG